MYETVKTVKGYQITRRAGTTGYYKVVLEQGKGKLSEPSRQQSST